MPLWKRLWLLVSAIWVIVAGLNAATILAFSEEEDALAKAGIPMVVGVAVPLVLYALAWGWQRWRGPKH